MTATLSRITISTDPAANIAETDLLIEAIVENMHVKHNLFAELYKAEPMYTNIVAT